MPGPPTIDAPCFPCGAWQSEAVWSTPDRAFAVPGRYSVVRCLGCGFLYQRSRVRDESLPACYPDHYPRHQEPSPRIPFEGSRARVRAVRRARAAGLGYAAFRDARPGLLTRLRAGLLRRRLRRDCLPWRDGGRYLDVGCGSGGALGAAKALGWRVAGIEMDPAAARKARRFSDEIHTGDILAASFAPGSFDVVTAFHVLEHVPDRSRWCAGCSGGWRRAGSRSSRCPMRRASARPCSVLRGRASSFRDTFASSPRTACGARWSGRAAASSGARTRRSRAITSGASAPGSATAAGHRLAGAAERRPVHGVLKLVLEVTLPLCRWARRGEVIRVGVVGVLRDQ